MEKTQVSLNELRVVCDNLGLELFEITYGNNDYPKKLGDYAIIGFDSFEECEIFSEQYGLDIHEFKRKYGHRFMVDSGNVYSSFDINSYVDELGLEYEIFDLDIFNERMKEDLNKIIEDFYDLESYVNSNKKLIDEYNKLKDDEFLITLNGGFYEVKKGSLMEYHADSKFYAIGCKFKK